ncbi:MAG: polymorphic toxin-type HINT domain-containing protein [Planctomycetaceae bacterium]
MSRLSPTLFEFARPLSRAGWGAGAVVGGGGPEFGSDSSLGRVQAGQTDSSARPDLIPCGPASYGGSLAAESQTPVPLPLAVGVEDGFDDDPGVLAGIARTFLSVAIVFAMVMGMWTASQSPVPRPGSNQPAVAGAVAFPEPAAHSSTGPGGRYRTKPIGEIQTGERVLAANPQVDHAVVTASEIDPGTWRNIRLRMRKPHGGTLDIVLLRPLAWLAEQVNECGQLAAADSHASVPPHAVRSEQDHTGFQLDSDVGHDTGWIHLALPELGAVGPAEVLAIEPCPSLASGPGRTVTGTFAHAAADVLDLEIEGLDTPLGCTANHPFWSADRHDFVPAGSLTIGEHLQTESGTLRQVTRITPRRGPPVAVFNLEVDAEHVYYVSTAGVLVHNAYPGNAPTSVEVASQVNPRLVQRLEAFRAYKANGGAMEMHRWVQATQGNPAYGTGFKSGFADWSSRVGKPVHGNSLLATGSHDVYVLRNAETRELLHFGETGRGYVARSAGHQRDYAKLGIDIDVDLLRSVEGKAAARLLEKRYIETYMRIFGQRPPYNPVNH